MEGPDRSVLFRGSAKFLDALVDDFSVKLMSFLGEKAVSAFGVRSEFIKLQHKLKYIKSTLNDAKRRRFDDSVTRTWIDELIDVMHDADDIIDEFRSEFDKQSEDQASAPILNQIVSKLNLQLQSWLPYNFSRFAINDKIIALNKKIDEMNQYRQAFSIDMNRVQSSTSSQQTSWIIDSDMVGKEVRKQKQKLVEVVTRNHGGRKLCLIAIVGMGGIGKTTLAQNVYSDPLMNSFQEKIWVCVSKDYSATELLRNIIKKIQPRTCEAETVSELLEELALKITGKRLFLVLDDVWQSMVLTDLLKNPLQFAASGVILLTTRDKTVAAAVGAIHVHEVNKLSRRSSWELLCKKAYIEEEEDMLNMREVGMGIVKKCDGLPLAIKVIGGLLATKGKDRREWDKVLQSNAWFNNVICEELNRALWISFEDLSPPLQNCFLYCSLYAEDFIMLREDLVRQWIAEGIVQQQEDDELLEDTGERYYNELTKRGLLQPTRFLLGLVQLIDFERQCQMHDIVRTFAQRVAQDYSHYGNPEFLSTDYVQKLHRLSIAGQGDVAIIPGNKSNLLRLRTLILYWTPPIVQDDVFLRIKNVRVLFLNGPDIKHIPDSIGDLKHLRMLDLDYTSISMLPASVCSLISLQFLHLQNCKSLKALPQGITRLSNLRCLGLENTPLISVPVGICRLKFLNELKGFIVASEQYSGVMHCGWQLDELESLTHLRCLRLDKLENAAIPGQILAAKCNLRTLQLSCTLPEGDSTQFTSEDDCRNIEETFDKLKPPQCLEYLTIWRFFGRRVPGWLENLPHLTWLILVDCISCHQLPPLGQLQSLKCLRIIGALSIVSIGPEFLGSVSTRGLSMSSCFPNLELLRIENMPKLEECSFYIDNVPERFFPLLKKLDIVNCPKLRALPSEMKRIKSLEEIFIGDLQGLTEIDSLTSQLRWVYIKNSGCAKISNIPRIQHLGLVGCSALRCVENLDALQSLYLEDESMDRLPEWLPSFLNQHLGNVDMELTLLCNVVALRRCLSGCPDWPIIQRFSHVHAFNKDNSALLEYLRQPYHYHTNL